MESCAVTTSLETFSPGKFFFVKDNISDDTIRLRLKLFVFH